MKKRVLLVASVASMIDQFNMSNIRILLDMGYEVHTACNFREGNTCDQARIRILRKTLQDMGIILHQWDCPRKIVSVKKCMKAYRQMLDLLEQYPFGWLHCHSPIGGALARMAAYRRQVRTVYTAHGFHFYQGAPLKNWLLYYPIEKLLAYRTDVLITIDREDYRLAQRKLKAGKLYAIPGVGIDTARFLGSSLDKNDRKGRKQFCQRYQIPEYAYVLLSVGELNRGKNHRIVIRALSQMHRTDVYYLICGQGEQKDKLQCYADLLGVGGQIRMPGFQEDMPWIYHNADIFVFPSVREGMPVALMEAMAAGLPCVVSDIRGNRELIGDPCTCAKPGGMKFSLEQPKQLEKAIERLLEDGLLRKKYGAQNQEKIKKYSQERVQKRMEAIYRYAASLSDGRDDWL